MSNSPSSGPRSIDECKTMLDVLEFAQRDEVERAIIKLNADFRAWRKQLRRGRNADLYRVVADYVPLTRELMSPYSFRIDESDRVFIVGAIVATQAVQEVIAERKVNWTLRQRRDFVHVASRPSMTISFRAINRNPPLGTKQTSNRKSWDGKISKMRTRLIATALGVKWSDFKYGPRNEADLEEQITYVRALQLSAFMSCEGGRLSIGLPVYLPDGSLRTPTKEISWTAPMVPPCIKDRRE